MKKNTIILILIFSFLSSVNAQEKELTINDAVIGQWRDLYPEYVSQLNWIPNTNLYSFVDDNVLIESSIDKKKKSELLNLSILSKAVIKKGLDTLKWFPRITWETENSFSFWSKNNYILYDLKEKFITSKTKFVDDAMNIEKSPVGNCFAYTLDNNLFFIDKNNKSVQITNDTNPDIVNGQEVHRREFGIDKGIFWSPKASFIAFYRKDESMVTDYPLVDISTRIATLKNIKYPMAGMKSHHVTLGVYDINSGETVFLKTGEPKEQYLTNVAWSPDEKSVFIAILNREQNHMQLKEFDVNTGELIKVLFEEKNEKYIEPQNPMVFLKSDSEKFIWQSRNNGFNHIFLYNRNGELIKQLTKGNFEVTSVIGFNKGDKDLFFVSTEVSPIERHIYKVNLKTGSKIQLTKVSGTHSVKFNSSYKYFIDTYSSTKIPRKIDIVSVKGTIKNNVLTSENPLKDYKLGEMSISTIKAADGITDLYYRLIKPVDFDPNKKYPAIIYVYGGPHAQLINNEWLGGARMWQYYMAQKGYVMLTVDNRGSANRGLEFENVIHRQLGVNEIADQMKGVELLKSLEYVDSERIGVHGWSFGGFLTTSLMLKKSDVFKVGVAGGPVIDWKYYEIMYGERYMDTPQENPEGYKENNLKNYVSNLKGKLLIIHGAIDNTVVWQNSLSFVRECVKQDILLDYFVYPRHEHNVRGINRVHLMRKVTQYFDDFL